MRTEKNPQNQIRKTIGGLKMLNQILKMNKLVILPIK
jgi:hypothetical protein